MHFHELKASFLQFYGESANDNPIHTFFAPGRVNLIGEHIDYNGGFVFPGALTLGIAALARKRDDQLVRMNSLNTQQEVIVNLEGEMAYDEKDDWGNYPKGVFNFLRKEGYHLGGYDILYWGDLPDAAGLSSSAAMEVLTGYMMITLSFPTNQPGQREIDRVWLAQFGQRVENQFIGVNSGIMDQFAVAMGKKDHAMLLNTHSLEYQYVPFRLEGYSLLIMNTNKRRELADSKYNERRAECEQVLAILNQEYHFKDLCSATMEAVDKLVADETLRKRARHVITENQRVLQAVEVLKQGDLKTFGQLLDQSHTSLRNDYEVTGQELDAIVREAQQYGDCLGARMTGAGFGGCAIALVKNESLGDFKASVGAAYTQTTGLKADFYTSQIGDGVHQVG